MTKVNYYSRRNFAMKKLSTIISIVKEVWLFLRVRKKWWLGPIFIFLLLFGAFIILTEGSAVTMFIYTMF